MTREQFNKKIDELSELYEQGKDCLNSVDILHEDRTQWSRLYEIIREMRDIAAVSLQSQIEE